MYTHDIRAAPTGTGLLYAETLDAGWDREKEGGGRVEDEDDEEWLLELLHKVSKCEEAVLYNVPLQL